MSSEAGSRRRRIILNSDGAALISRFQPCPMGVEGLIDEVFTPLRGSHVDTIFWALGSAVDGIHASNQWAHRTKLGQIFGEGMTEFPSEEYRRRALNIRDFFARNTDPAEIVVNHAHKIGMEAFLSIRMNDCHEGIFGGHYVGKIKLDHPDWTLGERAPIPMFRYAFDFTREESRKYRRDLIDEACSNYDLDGFELDFLRHPIFFAAADLERGRPIITQFVRDVRKILDRAGKAKSRRLFLAVRVPSTFALSRNAGLDVKRWIQEGVIDILTAGTMAGSVFRLPIEEYLQATRGTGVQVHAHFGMGSPAGQKHGSYHTDAMCRAQAALYWRAGVHGLYSFNANVIPLFCDEHWNWQPLREMGEPKLIAHMDKHYLVDYQDFDTSSCYGAYVKEVMPGAPLPVTLRKHEVAAIPVEVADDFDEARSKGIGAEVQLQVQFDRAKVAESAALHWNRAPLLRNQQEEWLRASLEPSTVHLGCNELQIVPACAGEVKAVEVLVHYAG